MIDLRSNEFIVLSLREKIVQRLVVKLVSTVNNHSEVDITRWKKSINEKRYETYIIYIWLRTCGMPKKPKFSFYALSEKRCLLTKTLIVYNWDMVSQR